MFETGDFKLLKRWRWVPDFLIASQYAKFSLEFSEMFNRETINQVFDDDVFKLKIINLATNLLPVLYTGLMTTGHPYFKEVYKQRYGKDYEGLPDLKAIIAEIEKLGMRLKTMPSPVQVIEQKGAMKFEEVITYVEMILERSIDREMKLYQFTYQYKLAVKRAEEFAKLKDKPLK
jgi:hypothetical protein